MLIFYCILDIKEQGSSKLNLSRLFHDLAANDTHVPGIENCRTSKLPIVASIYMIKRKMTKEKVDCLITSDL